MTELQFELGHIGHLISSFEFSVLIMLKESITILTVDLNHKHLISPRYTITPFNDRFDLFKQMFPDKKILLSKYHMYFFVIMQPPSTINLTRNVNGHLRLYVGGRDGFISSLIAEHFHADYSCWTLKSFDIYDSRVTSLDFFDNFLEKSYVADVHESKQIPYEIIEKSQLNK